MFKVKILTVGRCKELWLSEALAEYEKRLQPKMAFTWILKAGEKELEETLFQEPSFIALTSQGTLLSSEALSQKLFSLWGARPCFAIGGSKGLSQEILQRASFCWSFSPLTFTHQIVRLLLIEQLYRALEIEKGSSYHKVRTAWK